MATRPSYGLILHGEEVAARSGETRSSTNPATGTAWAEIAWAGPADVDAAVRSAQRAFAEGEWSRLSPTRRGRLLMRLADRLAEEAERVAAVETKENGKLLKEMTAQLRSAPDWLYYYGGLADKIEGRVVPVERRSMFAYTLREPVGVVAVITPWNSPVMLSMLALAPALAAGNTVVLKPSEFAAAGPIELARLAVEVGFPPGVLNVITGGGDVGAALVEHAAVRKISFTGGTETARHIGAAAGRRLVRLTLELGGKSPQLVFADADLDAAEAGILAGIFAASGQSCIAGSRLFVHDDVYDEMRERLVRRAGAIRLGDPVEDDTQMGPVATRPQLERVEGIVDRARRDGADVLAGGTRAEVDGLPGGFFYRPTVLSGLAHDSWLASEEVFGPVLTVDRFDTDEEATTFANATPYGLAAGVWTRDVKRAHQVARSLECGIVWINTYRIWAPQAPFGGSKDSGYGRANGVEAINEYTQTKTVWTELGDEIQDPFVIRS